MCPGVGTSKGCREARDDVSDDDEGIPSSFEAKTDAARGKGHLPEDVTSTMKDAEQQHRRSLEGPVDVVVGDVVAPGVDADDRDVPDDGPITGGLDSHVVPGTHGDRG